MYHNYACQADLEESYCFEESDCLKVIPQDPRELRPHFIHITPIAKQWLQMPEFRALCPHVMPTWDGYVVEEGFMSIAAKELLERLDIAFSTQES